MFTQILRLTFAQYSLFTGHRVQVSEFLKLFDSVTAKMDPHFSNAGPYTQILSGSSAACCPVAGDLPTRNKNIYNSPIHIFVYLLTGIIGGALCQPALISEIVEKMHCPGLSVR